MLEIQIRIVNPTLKYSLQVGYEELRKAVSSEENTEEKRARVNQLRSALCARIYSAMKDTSERVAGMHAYADELSRANFEQHLLPDEGTLRKIIRYESMLDRQLIVRWAR